MVPWNKEQTIGDKLKFSIPYTVPVPNSAPHLGRHTREQR